MTDPPPNPPPSPAASPRPSAGAGAPPPRRTGRDLLVVAFLGIVTLAAIMLACQVVVLGRAWWLHRAGRWDDEIAWLRTARMVVPWDAGVPAQVARLERDRVRRELAAGRLDRAVAAFREARREARARGEVTDRELSALGIEVYTRAADHVEKLGRLSAAADWDDSLFVHAIRGPEPHHRAAAAAAFAEGLELRVRDGRPCDALSRLEWAKKGLGGTVPNLPPGLEDALRSQCAASQRRRGR